MNITAATQVLAVIGDPVVHSLSPVMHNGWIGDYGIDAVYVALPLKSADPIAAIRTLGAFGLRGANVTVPYKEAAARAADRAESATANVLHWNDAGVLTAHNTDGVGFIHAMTETAPDWRSRVKRVLIIGAGGAAAGIAHALAPLVETIQLANRSPQKAEAIATIIPNADPLKWENLEQGFGTADLIIQATTLGMQNQAAPDWPVSACRSGAIVTDIVYRPLETKLLAAARARGLAALDGLGMLIHQGALAFELWFGVKPDTNKARARLLEALGQ
jgi:shikimate dehydrogenase